MIGQGDRLGEPLDPNDRASRLRRRAGASASCNLQAAMTDDRSGRIEEPLGNE